MLVFVFGSTSAADKVWGCVNPVTPLGIVSAYDFAGRRWTPELLDGPVPDLVLRFVLAQCALALGLFLLATVRLPREAGSRI
jgi:hypothetical protein